MESEEMLWNEIESEEMFWNKRESEELLRYELESETMFQFSLIHFQLRTFVNRIDSVSFPISFSLIWKLTNCSIFSFEETKAPHHNSQNNSKFPRLTQFLQTLDQIYNGKSPKIGQHRWQLNSFLVYVLFHLTCHTMNMFKIPNLKWQ